MRGAVSYLYPVTFSLLDEALSHRLFQRLSDTKCDPAGRIAGDGSRETPHTPREVSHMHHKFRYFPGINAITLQHPRL